MSSHVFYGLYTAEIRYFLNFFIFLHFLILLNRKHCVKSWKLVGNRQIIHILVELLMEISFHPPTPSGAKHQKRIKLCLIEIWFQKGEGKTWPKFSRKCNDLRISNHMSPLSKFWVWKILPKFRIEKLHCEFNLLLSTLQFCFVFLSVEALN